MTKRRRFTPEFKAQVVLEELTALKTKAEICREYRLEPEVFSRWRACRGLEGVAHLRLKVRRCMSPKCGRYHEPYRPEEEGRWTLPYHEFGLGVIAQIDTWRYQEHRTVPEIHQRLVERGVAISECSVTNQLERYDELVTLSLRQNERLQERLKEQERVILVWRNSAGAGHAVGHPRRSDGAAPGSRHTLTGASCRGHQ